MPTIPYSRRRFSRDVKRNTSFYSTLSSRALTIYVHSGSGSSGYDGLDPSRAKATLTQALALCTASRGDVIVLMPGHAETVSSAAAIAINKAGVTIVGQGSGSLVPTFTLDTATTATVNITAANVKIQNVKFLSNIDDLAVILDCDEEYLTLEDCQFVSTATKEFLCAIDFATTKDFLTIRGCRFHQPADPAGTDGAASTGAIYVVDTEHILVENCRFDGFFETACLHNKTTALKYLTWRNNTVNQLLTITGRRILLVAGTTGCQIGWDTDFVPGLGYKMTKTEDVNTATSDDLFATLGKIAIPLWHMEVTNALGAGVTDYQITATTLNGVVVAAGNIASAAIGFMRNLNGDAGDTALSVSTGAVSVTGVADTNGKYGQLVVGKGGLVADILKSVRTAGDAGDAIVHSIWYIPLEPGAYAIAAA